MQHASLEQSRCTATHTHQPLSVCWSISDCCRHNCDIHRSANCPARTHRHTHRHRHEGHGAREAPRARQGMFCVFCVHASTQLRMCGTALHGPHELPLHALFWQDLYNVLSTHAMLVCVDTYSVCPQSKEKSHTSCSLPASLANKNPPSVSPHGWDCSAATYRHVHKTSAYV